MNIDEINTCYPAKIVSYDAATQVATCKLQVEDYYTGVDYSYDKMEASLLVDVPVFTSQGGGWMLTFPIKEGDDCLVMFTQKGYDHWLYSGASETGLINGYPTAEHYRNFALEDAICIVGLRPIPRAIPNYNPEDCELRSESLNHRLTLKANGDIEMHTDTSIKVTATTVNVEASTVNAKAATVSVDSSTTTIKANTATIDASTATIKAPSITMDCPMTKFTGGISVAGGISMGGGKSSYVCELNGTLRINGQTISTGGATFASDVTASGKSVASHTHIGNQGKPTSPPQ